MVSKLPKAFDKPATIGETIYRYMKKAILSGEFEPGQRVQEKDIAGLFSVSTTPVREAFRRLATERFLSIDARREVVVTQTTTAEIKELFEVVNVLDIVATKKALPHLTAAILAGLRRQTEDMGVSCRQRQSLPYITKNLEIHFAIWEHCGNSVLRQTLLDFGEKVAFYAGQFFRALPDPGTYFSKSYDDHLNLIQALENRDETRVESILSSHWGKGFLP